MKLARTALLALAVSALFAGTANAATETTTFTVSITIENSCLITVNNVDFGTRPDLTAAIVVPATGDVTCTGPGDWEVSFSTGGSSDFAAREMTNGTEVVTYNLHSEATPTAVNVIGDGTGSTVTLPGSGNDSFEFWAATTAGQNGNPAGTYTDTITATVTF